ncbi:CocE/NonD family hydrolase [Nonomuraea sp. K274]|uniref:CocE/NonD family hydrolase n=2 Tax=Nonomuraea cypriaca TaxID=1187855 RepID=A0A931A3T6_9ACTN|nr:CocE/NonD family hydrolase [Nonomuraea cypriaca]
MRIDWDVPITMDDGVVLRADIFRPVEPGEYATIMSMGPYAKGLSFQEGYPGNWNRMIEAYPEIAEGTTNKYQNWELVDPEKWVPDGYVCVRIDSRGAGRSHGHLDPFSPRETKDFYECIEWAATQEWSNGRIGLLGISYYAINQWQVAGLRPPHLAAICVWEGSADYYREMSRHGGILCEFLGSWFQRQVVRVQHGTGERGPRSPVTGELAAGPETLSEEELAANRINPGQDILDRPLDGDYYRDRSPDFSKITVPLLSSGNWGGQGLHPRGNLEGYLAVPSEQKWLEMHGDTHFSPFYTDHGIALQKRFFGHFLRDEDTGWTQQPPVELQVRHPGEKFVQRSENEWPLRRTRWTKYYLDPDGQALGTTPSSGADLSYETTGDGLTFLTPPLTDELEITGPVAAHLTLSSDTTDADVFLALRVFDPDGEEVTFIGSNDPSVPVGLGWLRASHRKLDTQRSLPHRPWHSHDEIWPLEPGVPVELDVEIWPTCIVVPAGYRIGLTVRGRDYENEGVMLPGAMYPMKGTGPFLHGNAQDRPAAIFGGVNTLHFTGGVAPYLLLPVIPG